MPPTPTTSLQDLSAPAPEEATSSDADHSTYTAAEVEEQSPALGTATVQERGTPTEAAPKRAAKES